MNSLASDLNYGFTLNKVSNFKVNDDLNIQECIKFRYYLLLKAELKCSY